MTSKKTTAPDTGDLQSELKEMRARVELAEGAAVLLRAGLDQRWTDERVLSIFAATDPEDGWLGAILALLQREEGLLIEEAYNLEEGGRCEALAGAVGAAKRLRFLRERIIRLWEKASGAEWSKPKPPFW